MTKKGRPKGGTNRYWSKEEKYRVIKRIMDGEKNLSEISKDENISRGQLHVWIVKYQEQGIIGLENIRKPGNPLMKFQARKSLTELEQFQYENMKLRIENSRLKKGYTNEEAMSIKQKKSFKKNTK